LAQLKGLTLAAMLLAAAHPAAEAGDARCAAPPFGGSVASYKAFAAYFGKVVVAGQPVDPDRILAQMCNVKYGGADRMPLHKLGITDLQIANEDPEELAVHLISGRLAAGSRSK